MSEIVIHIQQKWEVQRGGDGVREEFSMPLFSPQNLKLLLLFNGWMGLCVKNMVSIVKRDWLC